MTAINEAGPALDAGPAPVGTRKRSARARRRQWGEVTLFAGPAVLVYLLFVLLPVVLAAYYSFFNWNGLGPLERFIGFDNYARVLTDPVFHRSVGNNFFILFLSLLIQGPLAILVALLMNRRLRFRGLLRALIFVPYVLSEVTAGLAWQIMLQSVPPARYGPIDTWLRMIGIENPPAWLADPNIVMWTMFGILTWKYLGLAIILMLAGLAGIPEDLYEAAALDGAGWWKTQWHITVPLLGPTIRIWAFLSIIGSLQLFDLVWIVTGGGPLHASSTMAVYMVEYGLNVTQIGYGSAVAVVLFLISLVVALIYQRFALRRDLQGALTTGVR
ncbi:sugar ABC transporter permease [Microbacterium sp.]|jgi:raffinose/stachyose/melibiose transport system permease protein|uniref:carbohydrate ABC transporter permease n=1 Tax=Microbacterium sp. TaxID=51671 RepID=UPI002C7227D5|nr:sugar ABC transporter permease [Microbacterium sp.]HWL76955.1 sugar ABC transporter permease [Microbacterium sp.]